MNNKIETPPVSKTAKNIITFEFKFQRAHNRKPYTQHYNLPRISDNLPAIKQLTS